MELMYTTDIHGSRDTSVNLELPAQSYGDFVAKWKEERGFGGRGMQVDTVGMSVFLHESIIKTNTIIKVTKLIYFWPCGGCGRPGRIRMHP